MPLQAFVLGFYKRCFLRSGIAGIGLGHLLGREHDSTPQSGVETHRLLERNLSRLYFIVVVAGVDVVVLLVIVIVIVIVTVIVIVIVITTLLPLLSRL